MILFKNKTFSVSLKPGGIKKRDYNNRKLNRLDILTLNDTKKLIRTIKQSTLTYNEEIVIRKTSLKMKVYRYAHEDKSLCCAFCGLKVSYGAVEREFNWYTTVPGQKSATVNLYGMQGDREVFFNVDHIKPQSEGGAKKHRSNLQLTCIDCNKQKGSTDNTKFKLLKLTEFAMKIHTNKLGTQTK